MPQPHIIQALHIPPVPWRNGGGQTRELLTRPDPTPTAPAAPSAWHLRISLADVDRSGPFSAYPGVERWFCVITGAGVRLNIDGREQRMDPGSPPLRFSGASHVACDLLAGPTRDLNLMTTSGQGQMLPVEPGRLWRSAVPQRGLFTRIAGTWTGARGARQVLAGQTLLWMDEAAEGTWDFVPDDTGTIAGTGTLAGPPGWWLAYAPETGGANQ